MRIQIFLSLGLLLATLLLLSLVLRLWLRRVPPGQALVVSGAVRGRRVVFTRALVLPFVERADLMDISLRALTVEPEPSEQLLTSDGDHLRYQVTFYLRVNNTRADVLRVAEALGCERASDPAALAALLRPKLVSALRLAASRRSSAALLDQPAAFADDVIQELGRDLLGFHFEDLVIDHLELASSRGTGPFR